MPNEQGGAPQPKSANGVILDPGAPIEDRVEQAVGLWASSGRGGDRLVSGKAFFLLYCWSMSSKVGRTPLRESADFKAYVAAALAAIGGPSGWDDLLRERLHCPYCGQTYRGENMQICAQCVAYTCPFCAWDTHAKGDCVVVG